ncbi:MAG: hypothetical protein IT372_41930 [Polyangiaceae bacterium]|nr:hypothetical protein [Polyangiaceae bacterium]
MKDTRALMISAMGACTCFGDITTAAAADRAGLTRARELPHAPYIDEETEDTALLAGHPISGITDGFEGHGRLCRIGAAALQDLLASAPWVNPRRAALFLVLPQFMEPEEDEGDVELDDAEPPPPRYFTTESARSIAEQIASMVGLAVAPDALRSYPEGRRGNARSLQEAIDWLRRGRCDHAIVGACDAELDSYRIARAFAAGRLKTTGNPVGFMPGEAGAFILLERYEAAPGRDRAPEALLVDPCVANEESSYAAEKPATGRGLSQVLISALSGLGAASAGRGDVYIDLNGEPYRSMDWGSALARAQSACAVGSWRRRILAANFGETGAAAPILAVCLAARSFAREYSHGPSAVVLFADDDGARAAIPLRDPRSSIMTQS